jgi:hypothetical protein
MAFRNQEKQLSCPICEKRPPKRSCPAKGEVICAVCCGTEREVTIDCPSNCRYLIASRVHDLERKGEEKTKVPFPNKRILAPFVAQNQPLLLALSYTLCAAARDNPLVVDTDVLAALQALGETYQTLTGGIYYEKSLAFRTHREIYEALKLGIEEFKKRAAAQAAVGAVRDADVRDALIFLVQLGSTRANGRPKGRAFLDFLRSQFKPDEFARPAQNIVLLS